MVVSGAHADNAVKTIDVYVTPYYASAADASSRPTVAVARAYDALLEQGGADNVRQVAKDIEANDGFITPMTLMVLSIRMSDAGLRDEAVFWFYVAKDRYLTSRYVLDYSSPLLSEVEPAVQAFASLAGPVINGYAFCDIGNQQSIRAKAVNWVETHPYKAVFLPMIPAVSGDREANLKRGVDVMKEQAAKEAAYLADPNHAKELVAGRTEAMTNERFCWR